MRWCHGGALAASALALSFACSSGGSPGRTGPVGGAPTVIIESPSGRRSSVRVEVARTPAEVARGLMHRDRLGADEGMLFVFRETSDHTFWMKDTRIPLDMIFIGPDRVVVGVVRDAEPFTATPRSVGVPSRYVLEVNAGWSKDHGVAPGDRVRFDNVPALP